VNTEDLKPTREPVTSAPTYMSVNTIPVRLRRQLETNLVTSVC
jgi:hypothetical protein